MMRSYLLQRENGEPADPAVFVDESSGRDDRRRLSSPAVWVVEPLD